MVDHSYDKYVDEPRSRVGKWLSKVLDSNASANLLIMAVILIASLPLLGLGFIATKPIAPVVSGVMAATAEAAQVPLQAVFSAASSATYECANGRSIAATFTPSGVSLTLSDGRSIALPQTTAASGARYSNPDESFVFSNIGNSGFVTENGRETYSGCVAQS